MKEESATSGSETPYQMGKRLFIEGVREFREGGFFEAHDLWEEFWQELRGPDRVFLQGLIHLAVGTYHFENGNENGAQSQLSKAVAKLGQYPNGHWGVDRSAWHNWALSYLDDHRFREVPEGLGFDEARFPAELTMAP